MPNAVKSQETLDQERAQAEKARLERLQERRECPLHYAVMKILVSGPKGLPKIMQLLGDNGIGATREDVESWLRRTGSQNHTTYVETGHGGVHYLTEGGVKVLRDYLRLVSRTETPVAKAGRREVQDSQSRLSDQRMSPASF